MPVGQSAAVKGAVTSANSPQPTAHPSPKNDVGIAEEGHDQQEEVKTNPTEGSTEIQNKSYEVDDFGLPVRACTRPAQQTNEPPIVHEDEDVDDTRYDGSEETGTVLEELYGKIRIADKTPSSAPETESQSTASKHDIDGLDSAASNDAKNPSQALIDSPPAVTYPGLITENSIPQTEKGQAPVVGSDGEDHTVTHGPYHERNSIKPSEWSHQWLTGERHPEDDESDESGGGDDWQSMPALGEFDVYNDFGHLVARGSKVDDDDAVYSNLGGAGKGYTRVQLDDDAQSATSLDEETGYLFKETANNSIGVEGDELRDQSSQLQATKDILTESQRVAYVGVTRLALYQMISDFQKIPSARGTRKTLQKGLDAMMKWGQTIMIRLYTHMDISPAEQTMIEQLAGHGVVPADLVRPLMESARIKNPLAGDGSARETSPNSARDLKEEHQASTLNEIVGHSELPTLPSYGTCGEDIPEAQSPSQLPTSDEVDIDIRWTVLCDLLLILIANATYDARSRTLLEKVGRAMGVSWLQISRFENRVIDALEMQEAADKETWDESEHMEKRRKMALRRKYIIMGLATVGGGLVIGLTGGLLGPAIGAGLAAGFTTIGITGTGGFLGGIGGTALIASGATLTGGSIGLRAAHRRTGAVQTFEYRPLHNNKRLNLIVTVGGWMTGSLDDIRLPYSTVDPIMGDLYAVLWEPDMLRSMGATINILATEALTQGLQYALGSTVLAALMASLQLPLVLSKLSYLIDNPWNVSLARANAAGLILADSLIDHNLGNRPVTLLGFSLGARVIFSCLKELASKGAHGLVQNVYLFGSPNVANKEEYIKARSVVSNRFVNGYASNDWILGYLFRATSGGIMRVAGLAPVEGIPGLENFDGTNFVNGHLDYRSAMPRLLKQVGWEVLSEEFAEIEDPDPENHAERQRELIREIDEVRKEAALKPEKKRFGLFKRGRLARKKGWETYDVDRNAQESQAAAESDGTSSVLFDIDAIRAELASENLEVRELESTLPPMRVSLNPLEPNQVAAEAPPLDILDAKSPKLPSIVPQSSDSVCLSREVSHSPGEGSQELQMIFDTSFQDQPSRPFCSESITNGFESHSFHDMEARSSMAALADMNAGMIETMAMEPNAWAEHDIRHGEEGEIHMSFE